MRVVGVDPSLRNTGLALAELNLETLEFEIVDLKLIKTEKSQHKTIRRNSDDLDRCRLMYDAFQMFSKDAGLVFTEMPLGSQSASGAKAYGMSLMMLASVQAPLVQVMPEEVKRQATGNKNATKPDMIAWATKLQPNAPWLRYRDKPNGAIIGDNEHLADAVAVIHAGIRTDQFRSALHIMRYQKVA